MPTYYAQVSYTGDGSTTQYAITFDYIDSTHVKAYLDGIATSAFTVSSSTLTFTTAPANGVTVRIERETPIDARLTDFTDGSVLTEADLDQSANQNFFVAQEITDDQENNLQLGADDKFDARSKVIKNVANPSNDQDAVTKYYLENTWLSSANKTALTTVNANIANINAVNSNEANINSVNSNEANINTVATNIGSVNTVATDISKVIAVANDLVEAVSEVETVADDLNEATSEIDTVATNIASVNTVGTDIANVNTVAGSISNVNSVAGSIANVNTVATNLTGINSFNDRYRVQSSDPSTSLDAGDLVFNTSSNELKYYSGTGWNTIASQDQNVKVTGSDTGTGVLNDKLAVSGSLTKTVNNAGANETLTLSVNVAEFYGFELIDTDSDGVVDTLRLTTTNNGADNIASSDYENFDDKLFAPAGYTWSINSSGNLTATI